jgi:hypothetical protein
MRASRVPRPRVGDVERPREFDAALDELERDGE